MQQEISDQAERAELAMEAILNRRQLEVQYNGERLELHPHQLFVRNDSIYLSAYNPAKSRRHDEEPQLGCYKLAGLSNLAVAPASFLPLSSFGGEIQKIGDRVLINVPPESAVAPAV